MAEHELDWQLLVWPGQEVDGLAGSSGQLEQVWGSWLQQEHFAISALLEFFLRQVYCHQAMVGRKTRNDWICWTILFSEFLFCSNSSKSSLINNWGEVRVRSRSSRGWLWMVLSSYFLVCSLYSFVIGQCEHSSILWSEELAWLQVGVDNKQSTILVLDECRPLESGLQNLVCTSFTDKWQKQC